MLSENKLEAFRSMLEREYAAEQRRNYPTLAPPQVAVKRGKRWIKIDVGGSGKYVVDQDGAIYGIKAYGVPHLSHRYGTLDTISQWSWGGYAAVRHNMRLTEPQRGE